MRYDDIQTIERNVQRARIRNAQISDCSLDMYGFRSPFPSYVIARPSLWKQWFRAKWFRG